MIGSVEGYISATVEISKSKGFWGLSSEKKTLTCFKTYDIRGEVGDELNKKL